MKRNAVVAQSGGPSPVINASLQGVIEGCRDYSEHIGCLYAAWHGVEGILAEQLIDLSTQAREALQLLRTTTAAGAIGTCRYKLTEEQEEDFQRILQVLEAHGVGYFFYIGGNDSMDTAHKVSGLAAERGLVILSDTGDSVFGGATGDSTTILAEMLRQNINQPALLTLVDPEVVAAAIAAGIGR